MNQFIMLGCLWLGACATAFSQQQTNGVNYQLEPIPSVHKPLAENSVPMGNIQTFEEVKLDLPITSGPYAPRSRLRQIIRVHRNGCGIPNSESGYILDRSRQEKVATGMPEKCTWRGYRRMKII